jgi:hypothetical protein
VTPAGYTQEANYAWCGVDPMVTAARRGHDTGPPSLTDTTGKDAQVVRPRDHDQQHPPAKTSPSVRQSHQDQSHRERYGPRLRVKKQFHHSFDQRLISMT